MNINKPDNLDTFDEVIARVIDESLLVIGESARKILYYHIENRYLLKPVDIPKKPELFILTLKSLLGAGELIVVTLIIKKLCKTLKIDYEPYQNRQFKDSIDDIRKIA